MTIPDKDRIPFLEEIIIRFEGRIQKPQFRVSPMRRYFKCIPPQLTRFELHQVTLPIHKRNGRLIQHRQTPFKFCGTSLYGTILKDNDNFPVRSINRFTAGGIVDIARGQDQQ